MRMSDFHIQWHITNRCNLRCLHCYQDDFTQDKELSWPDLKKVCDDLIQTMKMSNRKLRLSLTGGEPFLKEELFSIIDYLQGSRYILELNIITNATLINRYIKKLSNFSKVKNIYLSLEGVTPETNDAIRGEGSFKKVQDNIRLLKEHNFSLYVMFTILKKNQKDIEKLLEFCKENKLNGYILERFIPLGQSKNYKGQLISASLLEDIYKAVFTQCGLSYFRESVQFHALKVEIKNQKPELFGAQCVVAQCGAAIMPNADVFPCRRFNLVIGNLLENSFNNIWSNSLILKSLQKRDELKGKCKVCNVRECLGCRALAYALTQDYLEADPLCWLKDCAELYS